MDCAHGAAWRAYTRGRAVTHSGAGGAGHGGCFASIHAVTGGRLSVDNHRRPVGEAVRVAVADALGVIGEVVDRHPIGVGEDVTEVRRGDEDGGVASRAG